MTSKKATSQQTAAGPAVILFPMSGCGPEGQFTQEQLDSQMAQRRDTIRQWIQNPGVKAMIELIEMRTARASTEAIRRDASEWDRGVAAGQAELVALIRSVKMSTEAGG